MPHDFICYVAEVRNISVDAIKVPERLVFTYQRRHLNMQKALSTKNVDWWIYGENTPRKHECVFSAKPLKVKTGVSALNVAKRLLDHGLHTPTVISRWSSKKLWWLSLLKHSKRRSLWRLFAKYAVKPKQAQKRFWRLRIIRWFLGLTRLRLPTRKLWL